MSRRIMHVDLDAFYAAAQSLNFSQAARDLHITQSALSQRIKALAQVSKRERSSPDSWTASKTPVASDR